MSRIKLEDIKIMNHNFIINSRIEKDGVVRYQCYLIRKNGDYFDPERIVLDETEMQSLKYIFDVDSIEELNNKTVKTILYLVQGSMMQWPHFISLGNNNSYILLNRGTLFPDDVNYKIMNIEELCDLLGNPTIHDTTIEDDIKPSIK